MRKTRQNNDHAIIAIPLTQGQPSRFLGQCGELAIFQIDTQNKKVLYESVHQAPPHEPGLLPSFLAYLGIDELLLTAEMGPLFAHGHTGITGELKVRFRYPAATGRSSLIRAWIETSSPPFHVLKAELIQDQQVKARATGKFVEQADSQLGCKQLIWLSPEEHQNANL